MGHIRLILLTVWGATLLAAAAGGHMVEKGDVQVIHPWAEPSDGASTRVFPTVANDGESEFVVIGATAPIAEAVELVIEGQPVEEIAVPAGEVIAFNETEVHLRLVGLSEPLLEGGHFPMEMRLKDGNVIEFQVVVGENTTAPDLVPADRAQVNLTHEPIPALGWPTMTMDLALLDGVRADGLSAGDAIEFELLRGPDGIYGVSAIWPAGSAPDAAADAVRGRGVLHAITVE